MSESLESVFGDRFLSLTRCMFVDLQQPDHRRSDQPNRSDRRELARQNEAGAKM